MVEIISIKNVKVSNYDIPKHFFSRHSALRVIREYFKEPELKVADIEFNTHNR